jgi:hypothetical protein
MAVKEYLPTDGLALPFSKTAFLVDGYWSGFDIRKPKRVRIADVNIIHAVKDMSVTLRDRITFDLRIED